MTNTRGGVARREKPSARSVPVILARARRHDGYIVFIGAEHVAPIPMMNATTPGAKLLRIERACPALVFVVTSAPARPGAASGLAPDPVVQRGDVNRILQSARPGECAAAALEDRAEHVESRPRSRISKDAPLRGEAPDDLESLR
jgi:hypothetical protein